MCAADIRIRTLTRVLSTYWNYATKHFWAPHLATYDNLYLFLWSFDCHLCTKVQYNAAFFVI
jgi:hypothetical protein